MYSCRRLCFKFINSISTVHSTRINRSSQKLLPIYKKIYYMKHFSSFQISKENGNISNFDDLVKYVSKRKWIHSKYILKMLDNIADENLTEEHILFLLECSGKVVPGETLKIRNEICHMVLTKFEAHLKYSERVYLTYINICTFNKQIVDVNRLLSVAGSNISIHVLKSLLKNVCERGDTEKAIIVLSEMKDKGHAADEETFNNLILCNTIKGGLLLGQSVLETMVMTKLTATNRTRFAMVKGIAQRKQLSEFIEILDTFSVPFEEEMLIDLLDSIGFAENHTWIKYVKKFTNTGTFSLNFPHKLENICMNLVHNQKYVAALEIYTSFIESKPGIKYGANLIREMLLSSTPVGKIVEYAKQLKEAGLNDYALEDITDSALKYKLTTSAMGLLKHFNSLRPHYFWPILLEAHRTQGEKGLMEAVDSIEELNVKFDNDSFQTYIFPFCDLKNPKRVIQNFQKYGYSVRTLLTPMLVALLKMKETKLALEISNSYDVQIGNEDLLKVLSHTWISTVDHDTCLSLIQKISEFQKEVLLGSFLKEVLCVLKNPAKLRPFLHLLKDSKRRKLNIDTQTADTLISILRKDFASSNVLSDLENSINELLDFTKTSNGTNIIHPSNMNTEELECHLIELKAKDMETRGVLRKLIQKHTNAGNSHRVKELQDELLSKQYNPSPGMTASLMQTHIQEGNLSSAYHVYTELKQKSPNFKVDGFKLIDLATLFVRNNKFDQAADILLQEAKNRKFHEGRNVERNCRILLSSIHDIKDQETMFNILMEKGYCSPYNTLLGCLVELHLEKADLKSTIDTFENLAQKYRKTPMQLVLLMKTLEDGNHELLQRVLDITAMIHGTVAAQSALISALCEKNYKKQVISLLQNTQLNPLKEMEKRCERWLLMDQMEPLQTLLEISRDVSPSLLNRAKIQLSIMQLYSKKNDCDGAMEFWKTLIDSEDIVSSDVDMEFYNLLERCKYKLPDNLELKYRVK